MKLPIVALLVSLAAKSGYGSPVQAASDQQCSATPLATSINDFGRDLVKQIGERDNLFVSPLSIYTALAMLCLGAGGSSAEQIDQAFRLQALGIDPSRLHESLRALLAQARAGSDDQYSLLLANALFVQQNFTLSQSYVGDVERLYFASVKLVDFLAAGEEAKNEINKWAADNTDNKIPEFVQSPLEPTTKIALLNAVYFKGIWMRQFDEQSTVDGTFHGPTERKVKYMVMHDVRFRFYDDLENNYKFLELPYKGDHIKMLLSLPESQDQPLDLQMDTATFCRVNSSLRNTTLQNVIVPKFKISYRQELKPALVALGIEDVFSSAADLSGIREQNDLLVSKVQHEAVLEVNEEGSEAAAVTGIYITRLSIGFTPEFVANHPFLVHIIDSRNGLVLFSGQVVSP